MPGNAQPDSSPIRRVYLTGFMGAGKSTVGALLATLLGWGFHDVDACIEASQKASVATIFANQGEAHFRKLELSTLRDLQLRTESVISLGGGAVETEQVRSLLRDDSAGKLIFLEAPLERLVERCTAQDGGLARPLLSNLPLLASRYEKRLAYYQTAHLTVATQDLTPEDVAAAIVEHMAAFTR